MELTKKDKEQLLKWGYLEEDFAQIERAINNGNIESYSKKNGWRKISPETALRMIGRREFLSGVSRAAFHASAERNDAKYRFRVCFEYRPWEK